MIRWSMLVMLSLATVCFVATTSAEDKAATKKEKYEKIMESKVSTSVEALCRGYPAEFTVYLNYCKALRFEDRPDYTYLKRLFKDLFVKENYVNDSVFDWTATLASQGENKRKDEERKVERRTDRK